jgi:hypothetical protein
VEGRRGGPTPPRLRQLVADGFFRHVEAVITPVRMEQVIDRIVAREIDAYTAAEQIVQEAISAGTARTDTSLAAASPPPVTRG